MSQNKGSSSSDSAGKIEKATTSQQIPVHRQIKNILLKYV